MLKKALVFGLFSAFLSGNADADADVYVAIGDSITAGTNAASLELGHEYSWATGKGLRNFADSLQIPEDARHNVAFPGALSHSLAWQSRAVRYFKASVVSIVIGSNDFAWNQGQYVVSHIEKALATLQQLPHVRHILLGTVPNLEHIYQLGQGRPYCQFTHMLAPLFLKATDTRRAAVMQQLVSTNAKIKAMPEVYDKVTVVDLEAEKFAHEDISRIDCIHPSVQGQQRIAGRFMTAFAKL